MCQRYHVQHVFRSFLILIMSNPNPYLIQYRRYIWFKSDISVDNSLKSRVYDPFMSKLNHLCPKWSILKRVPIWPFCLKIVIFRRLQDMYLMPIHHFHFRVVLVVESSRRQICLLTFAILVSKSLLREGLILVEAVA